MPPHEGIENAGARARAAAAPRARAGAAPKFLPRDRIAALKLLIAAACLVPFGIVIAKIAGLLPFTPNPVEEVLHSMGTTGLNLLWITLAITPLRKLTKQNWLIRLRRMLGLFSFFYICLHLLTYVALDRALDFPSVLIDVTMRPYITAGMLAFALLLPLAVTSTRGWQRRLGRRWTKLHRLIYPAAVLAVVHFWWLVKADIREPLVYAVLLALLLGYRAVDARSRARRREAAAARSQAE